MTGDRNIQKRLKEKECFFIADGLASYEYVSQPSWMSVIYLFIFKNKMHNMFLQKK